MIDALTCLDAIHGWSPVDFKLDDLDAQRLHGGTHARVVGKLAGFGVSRIMEVTTKRIEEKKALRLTLDYDKILESEALTEIPVDGGETDRDAP